jgi:hypothetical protein
MKAKRHNTRPDRRRERQLSAWQREEAALQRDWHIGLIDTPTFERKSKDIARRLAALQ